MSDSARACENTCGYCGKCTVLILVSVGIALSAVASMTCEFLTFENEEKRPWLNLEFPFDRAIKAHVGIFFYDIVESDVSDRETNGCVEYDNLFHESDYEVLVASQFCALFAPIIAGIGLFVTLFELCVCSFYCSFMIASLLFLIAAGTQAGTFSLFAEPSFCFEDNSGQTCDVGNGAYLSGAAVAAFWISCLLLCCFPRPDPFCNDLGGADGEKDREEQAEPKVIVQAVVVDNPDYEEDRAEEPPPPERKSSFFDAPGDEKITADDFDTPEIEEGTSRVEIKEKTFPDGTRQVDEITHYADGSKSVKTQTFKPT